VLLDVALPSMYGFEVCEAVKKNPSTQEVKIILIASIYDKTRYKRSPQSLYGADDYIEKHHIPDSLAAMINRLVSGKQETDAEAEKKVPGEEKGETLPQEFTRQEIAAQEVARMELKQDEERETSLATAPVPAELPEVHVKARRLARIIVSDVVLYNQGKVEEGIRNGTFYKLLADDIQEGRALYVNRVPLEVRESTDYLESAFEELIAKKRREMNLS
jgi:response regulator RpfG family c-di-GMP phosphodiesterase